MLTRVRFGFITYGLDRPAFGISRSTLSLGRALERRHGVEPVFLTPYRHGPFAETTDRHTHMTGARLAPGLMTIGALELPLLARREALPLIHDPTGMSPFLIGRRFAPYKRVVTLYDATPFLHPETHTLLDNVLHRMYVPATLRNVDAVITISEIAKQDLLRFLRLRSSQIHVVHLAADPAFRPVAPQESANILARYELKQPFVLYLGALEPRKNVPTLVRAFARLRSEFPNLQLVLGGGQRWSFGQIPQVIEQLGLTDSVRVTGYVPDADLPGLYSAASVFCFISLSEGFGLPILEAMACGAVVVCSNRSSMPEVAGQAALLVDPTDVEGVASGLRRVLRDPDLANALRQRGLARAARFSWELTAERTVDVYRAVLETA
ncbi:MAG: glycosyltransferase family 4 protein [Chloroflexota bacterium]